jgi:predicted transcriptional regulator
LKFRILEALAWSFEPMTTKEIGEKIGVSYKNIGIAIKSYLDKGIPYIQRLKKKKFCSYRYKITKSGMKAYSEYLVRIERGFDLNRLRPWKVEKMETYGKYPVRKVRNGPEDFSFKKNSCFHITV